MKEGSKYQPLLEFLRGSNQREVILTFAEIEALYSPFAQLSEAVAKSVAQRAVGVSNTGIEETVEPTLVRLIIQEPNRAERK